MTGQRLRTLNESLSKIEAQRIELEAKRRYIHDLREGKQSLDSVEQILTNPIIQALRTEYFKAKAAFLDVQEKYGEKHPKFQTARSQLDLVRVNLEREVDKVLSGLDSQYALVIETERALKRALDETKSVALEINKKEIDYNKLKREADNNMSLYGMVLKRLKETDLTGLLNSNNVRRLDSALVPKAPIKPKVRFNIMIAAIIGLMGGIGLAFFFEHLDNTIKTQEDIERALGLAFLGFIPSIRSEDTSTPGSNKLAKDLYVYNHPKSNVAESCRSIRTNIMFVTPDNPARSVIVTSAGPQEGKSITAISIAISMALSGSRTVLVDTDMRHPRIHRAFDLENDRGISSCVVGEVTLDDAIQQRIQNPTSSRAAQSDPRPFTARFGRSSPATGRYDKVIFDAPPIIAVTDAVIHSRLVDGVIPLSCRQEHQGHGQQARSTSATSTTSSVWSQRPRPRTASDGYYYYYYTAGTATTTASAATGRPRKGVGGGGTWFGREVRIDPIPRTRISYLFSYPLIADFWRLSMKISIIGTYVGLVTGACLADMGSDVVCMDVVHQDPGVAIGKVPIYEPGSPSSGGTSRPATGLRHRFAAAVRHAEVCFIAVGTPGGRRRRPPARARLRRGIARLVTRDTVAVVKSTVPVGTCDKVEEAVNATLARRRNKFTRRRLQRSFKEGRRSRISCPDRVVGVATDRAGRVMQELYAPFMRMSHRVMIVDRKSAEMIKYASNAMLATRISFMNELAAVCEASGADIETVRYGVGTDRRIGPAFLYAGVGYGGSCLPKDVKALVSTAREHGAPAGILEAVERTNERQKRWPIRILEREWGKSFRRKKIAIWGLAFKPNTDDMREAPSVVIIDELRRRGASVAAHDPVAIASAKTLLGKKGITTRPAVRRSGADALILVVGHVPGAFHSDQPGCAPHHRRPEPVQPEAVRKAGLAYFSVGEATTNPTPFPTTGERGRE